MAEKNIFEEIKSFINDYGNYFTFTAALKEKGKNYKMPEVIADVNSGNPKSVDAPDVKKDNLNYLQDIVVNNCVKCRLSEKRKNIVFGEGSPDCRLMFIGEAPGADEDDTGRPFVGRAGQLLTKIIESINLKREDVYIANVIKCRPPGNRTPSDDEIECCSGYLREQVRIIKPRIICTLGKVPMEYIVGKDKGIISRVRGNEYKYEGIPVIPTYHPSYLLRNPSAKREVWEDMKKIRDSYL